MLRKYYRRQQDASIITNIALQISGERKSLAINILEIHALKTDLEVESQAGPENLEVTGTIKPKLGFAWKGVVKDKFTGMTSTLPNSTGLTGRR